MPPKGPFRNRIFMQLIAFVVILSTIYLLFHGPDEGGDINVETLLAAQEKVPQLDVMQIMAAKNNELKALFKEAAEHPRRIQVESEEDGRREPTMQQLGSLQREPHQPPAPIQMPEPESEDVLGPEVVYPPRVELEFSRRSKPERGSSDTAL